MPTRRGPQPRIIQREQRMPGTVEEDDFGPDAVPVDYRTRGASQSKGKYMGDFTGASKPRPPRVFRKFGNNTRQLVGYKHTGLWDNQYEAEIVQSRPSPALVPAGAVLAQSGAPSLLRGIPALKAGPNHWLFHG